MKAPAIVVRVAVPDDAADIAAIHEAAVNGERGGGDYDDRQIDAWARSRPLPDLRERIRSRQFFVASSASEPVGYAQLDVGAGVIRSVYVVPGHRRRSVGRRLAATVLTAARDAGLARVELDSSLNAVQFYEALGFSRLGDVDHGLRDGVVLPCVRMERRLRDEPDAVAPATFGRRRQGGHGHDEGLEMTGPGRSAPTLLFDLGGVLYENTAVDTLNALLGTALPADVAKDRWLRSPAMRAFESGKISPDRFAAEFLAEWRISLAPDAFLADFTALVKRPHAGAEELLERLRTKHTVACLSNSNELHWQRVGGFLNCFDFAFSSHLLGELKPDEGVFCRVMSELHVEPSRLLFFDESRLNVDAAAQLGIGAFLVDGLDDTRRVLIEEGLL